MNSWVRTLSVVLGHGPLLCLAAVLVLLVRAQRRLPLRYVLPLAMLLGLPPAAVRADSIMPPFSYTKVTADNRFVFVMRAPGASEVAALDRWGASTPRAMTIRNICANYAQSGLYRNDGSTTPLWTVNWYSYGVEVASDGVHLVRLGPWASSTRDEAVSFFANGQLLRTRTVSELVDIPWLLPHSVSHFEWDREANFDDAAGRYTIHTYDGSYFVFDVTTGQTTFSFRPLRVLVCAAPLVVIFTLLFIRLRQLRRTKRQAQAHGSVA